jgi:hypothetical protein
MTVIETAGLLVLVMLGGLAAALIGFYAGVEAGYRRGRADAEQWQEWQRREGGDEHARTNGEARQ